jgi:hypothetical protein
MMGWRDDDGMLECVAAELAGLVGPGDEMFDALAAARTQEEAVAWEHAAGDVALVAALDRYEPLPDRLRQRMLATVEPRRPLAVVRRERTAWLATAAALALAAWAWLPRTPSEPAAGRAALLARAALPGSGVTRVEWTPTDDPAAAGVSGDVVWDDDRQEGYMRFTGLARNDPRREQYQLWIFDERGDERHPVDGGVFDIPGAAGDVIVPIQAKLAVRRPALFAVTIEKPGGVVVSSRERLPLLAKVVR